MKNGMIDSLDLGRMSGFDVESQEYRIGKMNRSKIIFSFNKCNTLFDLPGFAKMGRQIALMRKNSYFKPRKPTQ
jgi:hypothetical protein